MLASEEHKNMTERGELKDRKKKKEVSSSSKLQSYDGKIKEMSKVIKSLSSKLARLEMGGRNQNRPP